MQCSCSAMSLDGDGYYSERHRVAAKDHICPECKGKIAKGEKYLFSTLFIDGGIKNSKMCLSCESVVEQFFPDGYYIGQVWEILWSYLEYSWAEDLPSNCLSRLRPDAKTVVCDMLQQFQDV